MNIFLDANIVVSVINKEYPLFTHASRILSLTGRDGYTVFTSPLCLAIAFYFVEKKSGKRTAREKIGLLASKIGIADTTRDAVIRTTRNPKINDFEDGLEYYSALDAHCTCMITEDINDFYFSDIEILTSESFYKKYLASKVP